MNKTEFISYLKTNNFPTSIVESYYNEVNTSTHSWDNIYFNKYLDHLTINSGVPQVTILQKIVYDVIIPYYKIKYAISFVSNKEGLILKYID